MSTCGQFLFERQPAACKLDINQVLITGAGVAISQRCQDHGPLRRWSAPRPHVSLYVFLEHDKPSQLMSINKKQARRGQTGCPSSVLDTSYAKTELP